MNSNRKEEIYHLYKAAILPAMEQYAQEVAIDFTEWKIKNQYHYIFGMWHDPINRFSYTTEELFELYKKEKGW